MARYLSSCGAAVMAATVVDANILETAGGEKDGPTILLVYIKAVRPFVASVT